MIFPKCIYSYDHTLRLWRVVPQLPDPPAALKFDRVKVHVHRHVVDVELKWLAPLSFGGPIIQYLLLRRRVRKGQEDSGEWDWEQLRMIRALSNAEAVRTSVDLLTKWLCFGDLIFVYVGGGCHATQRFTITLQT